MKKKIKVLHLGYSDNYGGASIAMTRINEALSLINEIDSKIAVVTNSNNLDTICLSTTFWDKIWLYVRVRLAYKLVGILQKTDNHSGRSINFFSSTVINRLDKLEFDVLHLHWIANETISFEDLIKINKPIVWTFYDHWALLGSEHTDINNPTRFIEGYTKFNKPKTSKGFDIDRFTWERKRKVFKNTKIQPVVVSSWLAEQTKKSYLWKKSTPEIIHVPLKIDLWKIIDKIDSRNLLNIPEDNKVIVFGAVNGLTDELKGYANLEKSVLLASQAMSEDNFTLLVFGDPDIKEINLSNNVVLKSIGKINDFSLINTLYCCADLVAVPSYVETFGQVAIEAITCGTPVVSFRTSGLLDIIIENFNGVMCEPYDCNDMANKIISAFSLKWDSLLMRKNIDDRFGYLPIAKKYESVYNKLV